MVFLILLLLVMVMGLVGYQLSGNIGIEERFTRAVGLESGGEEGGGGGWSGFDVEGNPLLYAVVMGVLGVACYAGYRYFRI
jgi:hypothetical protein